MLRRLRCSPFLLRLSLRLCECPIAADGGFEALRVEDRRRKGCAVLRDAEVGDHLVQHARIAEFALPLQHASEGVARSAQGQVLAEAREDGGRGICGGLRRQCVQKAPWRSS